jgi:hypothetical protein
MNSIDKFKLTFSFDTTNDIMIVGGGSTDGPFFAVRHD